VIVTERLKLRLPKLSDLEDIHEIFCDDEVMTYWSNGAHQSISETRTWLTPLLDYNPESQFDFFIDFQGKIVGKLGFWKLPEVGFILNRSYWGIGIASEAMRGLISYVREYNISDHLFADVDPRNLRSINLLNKFGFENIGFERQTFETHIGWCDSIYYKLELKD
jgi:ribosomal-protein-alanine N-acetyltransferase